jgi:hypothetical protein
METYRLRYDEAVKGFVQNREGVLRHAIEHAKELNKITTERKAPVDWKEAALFLWALAMGKYGLNEMANFYDDAERRPWVQKRKPDFSFLNIWWVALRFGPIGIRSIHFNRTEQRCMVVQEDDDISIFENTTSIDSNNGSEIFILDHKHLTKLHSAIITNHNEAELVGNMYDYLKDKSPIKK